MKNKTATSASALALCLIILAGCNNDSDAGSGPGTGSGSGSAPNIEYTGATGPANINPTNANELALGTVEATSRAIAGDSAQNVSPLSLNDPAALSQPELSALINRSLAWLGVGPEADTTAPFARSSHQGSVYPCPGGGSITWGSNDLAQQSESGSYEIRYNDCTVTEGNMTTTMDGTLYYEWDGSNFTYVYDLAITENGVTQVYNSTFTCDDMGCTSFEVYNIGGTQYKAENVSVIDTTNGYNVSMQLYHEDYGYFQVDATNLVPCDSGGGFQSGNVVITDETDDETVDIVFSGCGANSMTATYQGVAQVFDQ